MNEATPECFLASVREQPNGCWYWTGPLSPDGYGRFNIRFDRHQAHRVSYELFVEPIPDGLDIDHECHNRDLSCAGGKTCPHRRCVNPAHLTVRTRGDNVLRGRNQTAVNARKTHCDHGHPFDEANTIWLENGTRRCRACRDAANAARPHHGTPNGAKTHCPHGHEYTQENTYVNRKGGRICRACAADRRLRRRSAA